MKKLANLAKGIAAVCAALLALSTIGSGIVEGYRSALDSVLGTQSYVTNTDEDAARFKSDYKTIEEMAAAAKDIAIREGQEGTVIMKNDNDAFPLTENVALFGLAAYATYPYASGDLKAGNADAKELYEALADAGLKVNETVKSLYLEKLLNKHIEQVPNMWTGELVDTISYDNIYVAAPGDMVQYQIVEIDPARFGEFGIDSNWKSSIDKASTTGICVFARGAGEGNTYMPGSALDFDGNATGKDPLALSDEELAVVDAAKEVCGKVVVLINSGNNMVLKDIAKGGAHEVDGIAYVGVINDYQSIGIADVLTGKVNATGALADTFVADNASLPAVVNFGGDMYADYEIVGWDADSRFPGEAVANTPAGSFGGSSTYNGGMYIVEAEGIYIGYKYYETRYFDGIMNASSKANSSKGATQSANWDYSKEVLYTFGHGLSYLDYTQTLKSVEVDRSEEGNVTAVVEIKNNGDKEGLFLAQLYFQAPYTEYDKTNLVEKSAVNFLNSAKVTVPAGGTKEVTITVPTKYLASYDYKNAKTYILDDGDYLFTAAAGSHAAVNNFISELGGTPDGTTKNGAVVKWNLSVFDKETYSVENGVAVTNVADDSDLNYWTGTDTVTYLSRQDWDGTYPVNYNEVEVKIADSPKKDEWIKELRGQTYTIQTNSPATEAVNNGVKFEASQIGYEQLTNIKDDYWTKLAAEITIDEAIGAVIHGGRRTDVLSNVENPVVVQNEGVSGFTTGYTDEASGKTYKFNIHSQTLLGTSFNPELAYEWGLVEGNSGLWIQRYHLWGTGLTLRRTPYNGRNYEYISEDPMLTNRIGYGILQGCADKGILNGPKHMGCNDQEHNRGGISAYMTEQKLRETDLRGFQGALEEVEGCRAVMIAFNRIGATNAAHHVGMIQKIVRGEWNYTDLISTDMMNNKYYFNAESMVMAGVTQVADFATEDNHINQGEGGVDKTWVYISVDSVKNDSTLVEAARQDLKYQLFAFANSAVLNISTVKVDTWYDTAIKTVKTVSLILMIVAAAAWLCLTVLPIIKKKGEQ